jgi:hypothetical protein
VEHRVLIGYMRVSKADGSLNDYVPALVFDDGSVLIEGAAIVQFSTSSIWDRRMGWSHPPTRSSALADKPGPGFVGTDPGH